MPTLPPSITVKTSVVSSLRLRISPVPDWVTVREVEAELVEIVKGPVKFVIPVRARSPVTVRLPAKVAAPVPRTENFEVPPA